MLLVNLGLLGCDSSGDLRVPSSNALDNTRWRWKAYAFADERRPVLLDSQSSLHRESRYVFTFIPAENTQRSGHLEGTMDCRRWTSRYAYNRDRRLAIEHLTLLDRSEDQCQGILEPFFAEVLASARRYEVREDTLRIYAQGGLYSAGRPITLFFENIPFFVAE